MGACDRSSLLFTGPPRLLYRVTDTQCPTIDGKRAMPDQSAGRLRQAPGKLAQYFIVNRRAMHLSIALRDSSWQCPPSWILVVAEGGVARASSTPLGACRPSSEPR